MKRHTNGLIRLIEPADLVGRHFKFREFCTSDEVPAEHYDRLLRLAAVLDWARERAHVPLLITSGYRSPEHNAGTAGAAKVSQHSWMRAVDFRPVNAVPEARANAIVGRLHAGLIEHADELGIGGLGLYPARASRLRARIHVDQRPRLPFQALTQWRG
jgi:uncharacterized protein YcbK (DUF882 family)